MVNDVSGGAFDPSMFPTVAGLRVPFCLMHMRGTPATMAALAHYSSGPVADVVSELQQHVATAEAAGVQRWDLIVDPGIGFAKDLDHNLAVLRGLRRLREGVGRLPVLVGVSRKRFIGTVCWLVLCGWLLAGWLREKVNGSKIQPLRCLHVHAHKQPHRSATSPSPPSGIWARRWPTPSPSPKEPPPSACTM